MLSNYKIFSLMLFFISLYACKEEDEIIILHPNIPENTYSSWIKDSTIILDTFLLKTFDLDNDGISDLEFQLEERNNNELQFTDFNIRGLNATSIMGSNTIYNICTDSIYFIHYQIYIYRIYNCTNNNQGFGDTVFCASAADPELTADSVSDQAFSEQCLLYYKKVYTPTISPDGISEDLEKGMLPDYYILINKAGAYYLLKLRWDRPFFIIEEKRRLAG